MTKQHRKELKGYRDRANRTAHPEALLKAVKRYTRLLGAWDNRSKLQVLVDWVRGKRKPEFTFTYEERPAVAPLAPGDA